MTASIRGAREERKFAGLRVDEVEADGSFSGYASLFGKVDLGRDVVERGAFAGSLGRRGRGASACCSSTTRTSRSEAGARSARTRAG